MTTKQPLLSKDNGILHFDNFTAKDIETLLADKHSKDVFIPQCKNGETWGAEQLLKLDAWVLLRTYSPLTTIGYEIKVDRNDFENDRKWTGYYELCHLFYFVCPAGLIRKTELPDNVGLMWVSQSGKFHIVKRATRHEPNTSELNKLLIQVVMARAIIVDSRKERDNYVEPIDKLDAIRNFVEQANKRNSLAEFVSGHVKDIYEKSAEREREATRKEYCANDFAKCLKKLGIVWNCNTGKWEDTWEDVQRIKNEIESLRQHIDWQTLNTMEHLATTLKNTVEDIKNIQNSKDRLTSYIKDTTIKE